MHTDSTLLVNYLRFPKNSDISVKWVIQDIFDALPRHHVGVIFLRFPDCKSNKHMISLPIYVLVVFLLTPFKLLVQFHDVKKKRHEMRGRDGCALMIDCTFFDSMTIAIKQNRHGIKLNNPAD